MMNSALLLIDLQNDFCQNGSLAVPEGDSVIDVANQAITLFQKRKLPIVASQDWHPAEHRSFAANSGTQVGQIGMLNDLPQVWWPVHCVQETIGAEFHPKLHQSAVTKIVRKGQQIDVDSYSAFFDNGRRIKTELDDWLKENHVTRLFVMGLATDYCVKFTVLDALALNYDVTVIIDGCRGVNLQPQDSSNALQVMADKGAKFIMVKQVSTAL